MILLGFDVNFIWGVLAFYSLWMIAFGTFVIYFENKLPRIFSDAFRYGKTLSGFDKGLVTWIQVPKAYFGHFYIFASVYIVYLIYTCLHIYLEPLSRRQGVAPGCPEWMREALDFLGGTHRRANTHVESIVNVLLLFAIQSFRRFYECFFVNVNTGSKMNVLHYIVGITHYFFAFTGVLLEAPGFDSLEDVIHYDDGVPATIKWLNVHFNIYNFSLRHVIWTMVFMAAWNLQFSAHKSFARLKNVQLSTGDPAFAVPYGGGFDFVSCPHYSAEILMYLSAAGICGFKHTTLNVVALWVLINQVISGLMSHQWYIRSFPNYPSSRKAVIPFLI